MAPPEIFWSTLHTQLESLANNVKHESTTTSLTSSSISVLSLSQAARRVSVDQARDTVMPLLEQGRSKFHGEVAIQTIIHTLASVSIMVTVTSDEASASSGKAFLKECCLHQSSPRDVWCCALGLILDVSGGKSCAASFLAFYFGDLLAFYFSEEDEEEGNDVNGYQNDCELSVDNEERIFFVQGTQRLLSIVIEVLLAIPQDGIAEVFGCPLSKKSEEETYDKQDIGNSEYTPDDLDNLMGSITPLKQRKRLTLREKVEAAGILCDGIESDNENENENLAEPTSVECDVEESDGDEMEAMTLARFVNGALGSKDGSVKKLALEAIAVAAAKDPNSFASPAAAIFARAALSLTSSPLASASSSAALSSSFNFKATCVRFASECIRKGGLSALQSAMPELGEYICQHDGCAAWGHASATALACLEWDDAFGGSSNCTNSSTCDLAMSLIMAQLRGFTGSGSLLDRLVWKATSNATALQCICNVAELATRRILDDTRFNLEEVLCGTGYDKSTLLTVESCWKYVCRLILVSSWFEVIKPLLVHFLNFVSRPLHKHLHANFETSLNVWYRS